MGEEDGEERGREGRENIDAEGKGKGSERR